MLDANVTFVKKVAAPRNVQATGNKNVRISRLSINFLAEKTKEKRSKREGNEAQLRVIVSECVRGCFLGGDVLQSDEGTEGLWALSKGTPDLSLWASPSGGGRGRGGRKDGLTRLLRQQGTQESAHKGGNGKGHSWTVGEPGTCGLCSQRDGLRF